MRKLFPAFFIPLFLVILGACSHMSDMARVHPARESVLFEGIEFKLNSREYRYSPLLLSGKTVTPEDIFIIVEVSLRNSYSTPVPAQFQPRFTLVDSNGREHEPEKEVSPSPKNGLTELSPQTAYTKKLVFDVPEGGYRLRVFTPIVVKSGPDGSMQGRYFYYDLR